MQHKLFFILFFVIAWWLPANAATIGSDTAVNRFSTQQTLNNGDRIAGFAWLTAGFLLNSQTVSGTFDSTYPVLGTVDLNYGTLILNQDLLLNNVTTIAHWGNITGQSHIVSLPAQLSTFPSTTSLTCGLNFQAALGHGVQINSVDVSFDNAFVVSGTNLNLVNALFVDTIVNQSSLTAATSAVFTQNVLAVSWHPAKDWIAAGGVSAAASNTLFNYSFTRPAGPLTQLSSISFGGSGNNCNSVEWHSSGLWLVVGRNSSGGNPKVAIYPVNSGTGAIGAVASSDSSFNLPVFSVDFNTTGTSIAAGTGTGGGVNELRLYSFNSGTGAIALVTSVLLGTQVNAVSWGATSSTATYIAVGVNFIAAAPVNNHGLLIYKFNSGTNTLTQVAASVASSNVNAVDWNSANGCLTATTPTGLQAFYFSPTTNTLTLQSPQSTGNNVTTARYSPNGAMLLIGDNANNVSLYVASFPTSVIFSNVTLNFNGNSTFNAPAIQFSGNSIIDGRSFVFSLGQTFTLSVLPNSNLLIRNATIKGLGTGLGWLIVDTTSTVTFQEVVMNLDNDYTFTSGRIDILNNVEISGLNHNFIYQSPEPLYINSHSNLILDNELTFSYDAATPNLLQFADATAQLTLNGATLHTTMTGLQLTKGTLLASITSQIASEVAVNGPTIIDQGITIGNNNAANDLTLIIAGGALLSLSQGSLNYKNVLQAAGYDELSPSLRFLSSSSILHMGDNTTLRLYQNMPIGIGVVQFDDNVTLARVSGKSIIGASHGLGTPISITAISP